MTTRVLVAVICVLAVVCSGEEMPNIDAEYPDSEDYNRVTLTCSDRFGTRLDDAEFLRRAPDQGSRDELPGSPTNGKTTVTLTQEDEGYFSCSSVSGGGTSTNEIGLAGEL